jgi:hypothetical protein
MKKIIFLCGLMIMTSPSLAREADFPNQFREINRCYIEHRYESLLPGTEAELRKCMREHGFVYCKHCSLFPKDKIDCWQNSQSTYHSECYRPIGSVSDKGYPVPN